MRKAYETILDHIWWLVRMTYQFLHLSEEVNFLPGKDCTLLPPWLHVRKVRGLGYAKQTFFVFFFIQKNRSSLIIFSSLIKICLLWYVICCPSQN